MTPFGTAWLAFIRSISTESRLRLAPTPSGYLHVGNACNFLLNWLATRFQPGARLLLRIDDLDADRKRPEYIQDIFDTLDWLGLDWDEGPTTPEDFESSWSQHRRIALYQQTLEGLRDKGFLFPCAKSRRELAPFEGHYPREFRNQPIDFDDPEVAWRVRTPESAPDPVPEDFIVRRRDGLPAYQLASLADDLHFGITHIIRGEDLRSSTAAQRFLAECLGYVAFGGIAVLHHPLWRDEKGEKLSKSAGAAALKTWREEGRPTADFFRAFEVWLGLPPSGAESALALLSRLRDF